MIVPDVADFPGHVACDERSRSEIAVPVRDAEGAICAVLDVDSQSVNDFDETDADGLGRIADILGGVMRARGNS